MTGMKTCRLCHVKKERAEFPRHSEYVDGLDARCYECRREVERRRYAQKEAANLRRVCPTCGGRNKTKLEHCPACYADARERLSAARRKKLKSKYNLSGPWYLWWSDLLEGKCRICNAVPYNDILCVDHDHETGEVRGLLCSQCNTGLGMFRDNPELLTRARKYLTGTLAKMI